MSAPADLGQLNTLRVSARAERLVTVTSVEELVAALREIPADSPVHALSQAEMTSSTRRCALLIGKTSMSPTARHIPTRPRPTAVNT